MNTTIKNTPADPSPILAFVEAAKSQGWVFAPCGYRNHEGHWEPNTAALTVGGQTYPTLRTPCGAVQVGIDSTPRYYHDGRVWIGCPTDVRHDLIVIAAIVVAPEFRRKRYATETLKSLAAIADAAGFDIELEATPIPSFKAKGQRTISSKKLREWYKSLGFAAKYPGEGESILVRRKKGG